jgi:hypothetical protein
MNEAASRNTVKVIKIVNIKNTTGATEPIKWSWSFNGLDDTKP